MPWKDPLLAAVQYKSYKTVEKLLRFNPVSVDGPCRDFISPLQMAITNNDIHCVKTLIQHKANVNLPDSDGDTALHLAAVSETSFTVFNEVLKAGANMYCKDITEKTPLHYACSEANIDKVVAMLKCLNPPVNEPDEEGATPLHFLVAASSEFEDDNIHHVVKTIKLAIKKGFNINTKTKEGETILHVASRGINSELFTPELLKIKGINVTIQNKFRENFIHTFLRCRAGIDTSERFMFHLLDEKLYLVPKEQLTIIMNQQNNDGHIPVSFYIIRGIVNVKLVKHFIMFIQNINTQEKFGHSLLHLTSHSPLEQNDKIAILKYLIKRGADVNIRDIFGRTALFFARKLGVVKLLVESGADLNLTDQCRRTLIVATFPACDPRICQYLINKGCRVNKSDKFGSTALHYAAWENRIREVDVLIRNGADVYKRDRSGRTPHDTALFWKCWDTSELLEKSMTKGSFERPYSTDALGYNSSWINLNWSIGYTEYQSISNLREHFDLPKDIEKYYSHVLNFPGVGLPEAVDEARWIESLVLSITRHIANQVGYLDKRFKCSLFRSGSTYEGTKVDDPDEFDFLLILDKFSQICTPDQTRQGNHFNKGFYNVRQIKNDVIKQDFQYYFDHEKFLNCKILRDDFFVLVKSVLTNPSTWIYDEVFVDGFSIHNRLNTPTINFKLFIVGENYKGIHASIDIVPAIRVLNWRPIGANLTANNIVSERVLQEDFLMLCQHQEDDEEEFEEADTDIFFRISCAPLELQLMRSFPKWIRQSYSLAKIMKSNFVCPKIKYERKQMIEIADTFDGNNPSRNDTFIASDEISSYMLKNCLFHTVDSESRILHELPYPHMSVLYNSIVLALKIYDLLEKSAIAGKLPVFLLPRLNIFEEEWGQTNNRYFPDEERDVLCEKNVTKCEKIKMFSEFIRKLNAV
ncbi:unnamed protein product [Mytilus coruscus]|uniref:Mab-21-like nucleotidyltransferase domain-containing protein n=1 Tax=Mytilus coruscus TaxID=42192 RepID=A0A6J8A237_MYTCO|nr:unnamed protein product [Mytilus coruscus]